MCVKISYCFDQLLYYLNMTSRTSNCLCLLCLHIFARRTLPTYPTYSVHVYVCIFIIHNKYKLCTYIHVCAPRVQYIVVKVGCQGYLHSSCKLDKNDVNLLHSNKHHYTHQSSLCFKVGSCFDQLLNYFNMTSRTSNYQSCFISLVFNLCVYVCVCVKISSCFDQLLYYLNMTSRTSNCLRLLS